MHVGQKQLQLAMLPEYFSSLDYFAQRRYLEKLKIDRETLPDPYAIAEDLWTDNVSSWVNFEFGDLYTYLIDSTGQVTKEKLRAFKSLKACNYFSVVTCKQYFTTRVNPESLQSSQLK